MLCRIFLKSHGNMEANGLKSPADNVHLLQYSILHKLHVFLHVFIIKLLNISTQKESAVQF